MTTFALVTVMNHYINRLHQFIPYIYIYIYIYITKNPGELIDVKLIYYYLHRFGSNTQFFKTKLNHIGYYI